MSLRRTKLLDIKSVTGIATVGIFTAGETQTTLGTASTTYVRGVLMHNTGLATATSSVYLYPSSTSSPVTGLANPSYRMLRVDLASNETFFFEANYPIVLTGSDKIVVEVSQPGLSVGGAGIGSAINFQVLGDTDF